MAAIDYIVGGSKVGVDPTEFSAQRDLGAFWYPLDTQSNSFSKSSKLRLRPASKVLLVSYTSKI